MEARTSTDARASSFVRGPNVKTGGDAACHPPRFALPPGAAGGDPRTPSRYDGVELSRNHSRSRHSYQIDFIDLMLYLCVLGYSGMDLFLDCQIDMAISMRDSRDVGEWRGRWCGGGVRLSASASGREGSGPARDDGVCLTTVTGPWDRKREESAVKRIPDPGVAAESRTEPAHHLPLTPTCLILSHSNSCR